MNNLGEVLRKALAVSEIPTGQNEETFEGILQTAFSLLTPEQLTTLKWHMQRGIKFTCGETSEWYAKEGAYCPSLAALIMELPVCDIGPNQVGNIRGVLLEELLTEARTLVVEFGLKTNCEYLPEIRKSTTTQIEEALKEVMKKKGLSLA